MGLKEVGRAALFVAALGGATGCDLSQKDFCKDYYPGRTSKVEDGACLPPDVSSVDELKATCAGSDGGGEVVKMAVTDVSRGISGEVWGCFNPHVSIQ